jgi:putative transposase
MKTSPMVGVFREGVAVKYAWIQEHQDSYPVQTMCCLLGVSRSGFYKWLDATPSPRAIRSETIKATVRRVFEVAERSVWALKNDWTKFESYEDLDDAKISVFKYIGTFYSAVRLHQTPEYQSPDQFERKQKIPLVA